MKKIKEIWDNNRIILVLSLIIILCFMIMLFIGIKLFVGMSSSPYGDRLEGISEHPFTDEIKTSIMNKIKESDKVLTVNVHDQGKIIYVQVSFTGISLDKAKEIIQGSLESFTEDIQKNYDIEFILTEEASEEVPGFTIIGAKNIQRNAISWNNNTPYEVEKEENEENAQ
ncbi:MAG: hypothetical protein IJ743_01700 [Bacilli bacterium]|nr:hypothetical protein [Bacilli bacterium]MBR1748491.1 hypothetical protein [Bacilli bacterium]MBR1818424.1 hypothetical protein [Bacilli bacterium]